MSPSTSQPDSANGQGRAHRQPRTCELNRAVGQVRPDPQSRPDRSRAGFVAYWRNFGTDGLYVFERVLFTPTDVGQALMNLELDLRIDGLEIATADEALTRGVELALVQPIEPSSWTEATHQAIRAVMGVPIDDSGGLGTAAAAPPPDPSCC